MSSMREFSPRMLLRRIESVNSRLYSGRRELRIPINDRNFYLDESLALVTMMRKDLGEEHAVIGRQTKLEDIQDGILSMERSIFGDCAKKVQDPMLEDLIRHVENIDKRLYMAEGWTFFGLWSTGGV